MITRDDFPGTIEGGGLKARLVAFFAAGPLLRLQYEFVSKQTGKTERVEAYCSQKEKQPIERLIKEVEGGLVKLAPVHL